MFSSCEAALCGTVLLVAACAHDHNHNTASQSEAATAGPTIHLPGHWAVGCHQVEGQHAGWSTESVAFAKDGRFVRQIKDYTAAGCPSDSLDDARAYTGTYRITGPSTAYPGAYDLDFTITGALATAYGPAAVAELNGNRRCNRADWARGVRRSVLGADCPGETLTAGSVIYDLVEQEGPRLFFGATSYFRDGSSPTTRPARIDQRLAFDRTKGGGKAPVAH